MLVLTRADLERLLDPASVIDAVESAFREAAAGHAVALPRAALPLARGNVFLGMVSTLPRRQALGAKLITVIGGNRARGLPTVHAQYLLSDPDTGQPLAFMEAGFLTAIRTGAASAVAARHLARADSRRILCFGAGVQAEYQLRCLQAVLPVESVGVAGRDPGRAKAFVTRMRDALGVPVAIARDPRAAVREADVITCATTASHPLVAGRDLRPGVHLDAVGSFRPHMREIDTEGVKRAYVVVDTYEGAWEEAGDLLIPIKARAITRRHVKAELAQVVARKKPGRASAPAITLFKSVGWAPEDAITARLAYDRAMAAGVGTEVSF
ncbi:MAG TPA: ornithine cyclodeaminase family protein [Candidatus Bathyarchaeia archaeon]|nr:ornithine cyclodeaminase family protein [Candidatus Bathyarchaeia archaeon]